MSNVAPVLDTVEITTLDEAMAWGDAMFSAYAKLAWRYSQLELDLKTERSIAETEPYILYYANREADMARLEALA